MIDLNKEYKTRNGYNVKLMGICDGYVVGIVFFTSSTPSATLWEFEYGKYIGTDLGWDLVEVKHPITHSAWVNVYENGFSRYTHLTRESADIDAQEGRLDCIELKYETII